MPVIKPTGPQCPACIERDAAQAAWTEEAHYARCVIEVCPVCHHGMLELADDGHAPKPSLKLVSTTPAPAAASA